MQSGIDVNADAGESFGRWWLGDDDELLKHVSSVNVACGFHAGDPITMQRTVLIAKEHGVALGAHPGLPDVLGFGRRMISIGADELVAYMLYQIGALAGIASERAFKSNTLSPMAHSTRCVRLTWRCLKRWAERSRPMILP
jgi:UPF0271 protein